MLFAVHISDGVLAAPWWVAGFVAAAALLWLGARRLRDDEIPRIALLTAAFFVASTIHVRVGPTSIHLLLNGLVGVLLGWRGVYAIAVGLALQAVLLQHGGFTTLGLNACVLTVPALLARYAFRGLNRLAWLKTEPCRSAIVFVASAAWFLSCVYALSLLHLNLLASFEAGPPDMADVVRVANTNVSHPAALVGAALFAAAVTWAERQLENAPEFPLGLVVGELTVLATVALSCVVLIAGGEENWQVPALLWVVAHLPVAVVEGVILGFAVGFLARVKPEMLGLTNPAAEQTQEREAPAEPLIPVARQEPRPPIAD